MHRSVKAAAVVAAIGLLAAASAGAAPRGWNGGVRGRGMVGGRMDGWMGPGSSMMNGRGFGPGSEVPGWENLKKLDKALTVETAKERAASALKDWGFTELTVDSVLAYGSDYYALVKEKASGKAALELYVDAEYGVVRAASVQGWNTTYGRSLAWPLASGKTISADEARKAAEQWLARIRDTTKYELKVVELPGYYSVQLLDGGTLSGLVAVNAYTGQVWYRGGRGGRLAGAVGCLEG